VTFAEVLRIPVANTFMAKGVMPFSNELSLGHDRLEGARPAWFAFERADVVICVGYDMVEYHPECGIPTATRPSSTSTRCRRRSTSATSSRWERWETFANAQAIALRATRRRASVQGRARRDRRGSCSIRARRAFPVKPQKIVWDLREVLGPDDIAICDVGAHKMWMSRMYAPSGPTPASSPTGSRRWASPCRERSREARLSRSQGRGRDRRRRVHDELAGDRDGDAHEDAVRGADLERLGIRAHHLAPVRHFGRPSHIAFKNPDFVKYAESFGAKGYRIEKCGDLVPTLRTALAEDTVSIIDCPVDYSENMKLTERLKNLRSPL
jgi:acetolactate synthase-1/2/3 large subunit